MGILKNWRERWIYHRNIERNKIMKEIERETGEKISPNQKSKATKEANKTLFQRMGKRIAVFLGAIGITVGGVTLALNSGEKTEPEPVSPSRQETDIDQGKDNEKPKTDREKFLEGLQEGVGENTNETQENLENVVDEILEKYNENLPEEEKIDKDDLGIIFRDNVGEAHVRQAIDENGEKIYIENPLVDGNLPEGEEWIEARDIQDEYILVNTENKDLVAGIGTIDYTKTEIDVQYANFGGKEYVKNDETYVGLPEDVDLEEAYEDFSDYYQFRVQQQEEQQRNDDGFEH